MSVEIIKQNILLDNVDRTASAVLAANSATFTNVNQIPAWLYTSITTMYVATSADFPSKVATDLGTGSIPAGSSIVLTRKNIVPSYLDQIEPTLKSNQTGAESSLVEIILKQPRSNTSITSLEDASNRLMYILDYYYRSDRGINPNLTVTGDKDINPDSYFRCFFFGLNLREDMRVGEVSLLFKVEYLKSFGV